jgi:hypothetical protein
MRLEGIAVTVMPWAFSDEKQGPGNQRIRPNPPSSAARRAGRTGGRPPKLTDDDIEAAKAMLANSDIGVTQIAHRPRRVAGDAVSIYARRAEREYPRRLRTAALSQRWDAPGRFQPGGGRRQCADPGIRGNVLSLKDAGVPSFLIE